MALGLVLATAPADRLSGASSLRVRAQDYKQSSRNDDGKCSAGVIRDDEQVWISISL